jgi:hypothetical protein
VGTTTQKERGKAVLAAAGQRQRQDYLAGVRSGAAWDRHQLWEVCRTERLKEKPAAKGDPSIQNYFLVLLKVQPSTENGSKAPLQITDTHADASLQQAFGGRPDAVVHPVNKQALATYIAVLIELKKTGSALDAESIGQVVG